jgi:two-component system response regulator HydG
MTKRTARILLLEDDPDLRELLEEYYEPRGYIFISHSDPTIPLRELEAGADALSKYDLVLTDLKMPNLNGIEFITRMKKLAPKIPIILMTAHSSVEIAIDAIDAGAYDFVVKPLHFAQLNVSIERALRWRRLQDENQTLRTVAKAGQSFQGVVGKSLAIQKVFDLAKRVSNSTATVLIRGESGTGKEVVARAIHLDGSRKKEPFVAINCSAIPENLLESELFGHAKGAFTGAVEKKLGLFEEANGGTLFLDEIGDLNATLQAKLLRVLQERKIKRIGENVFRSVDVRILAATHKNLSVEVQENRFREDLFFRLNVIPINIPPLRERKEDILPLAEHFLKRFSAQNSVSLEGFTPAAVQHLLRQPWRGNVRELENAIERAVVLCTGSKVDVSDLSLADELSSTSTALVERSTVGDPSASLANISIESLPTLAEYNLEYIGYVLKAVNGVKEQAAKILNLDRKTLYRRIREIESLPAPLKSARKVAGTLRESQPEDVH